MIDNNGKTRISQHCQLVQSSFKNLQSSKLLIGLGRTNNYIDNMAIRTTDNTSVLHNYRNIIPNSAIVVNPLFEDWKFELYMNPASNLTGILVVLLFSMFCMSIVIMILGRMESEQDLAERKQRLHTINFDAL